MFITALTAIALISVVSYIIASRELTGSAAQTMTELVSQGSRRLDERKKGVEESSFRILQMSNVESLLRYTREEADRLRTRNEGLPAAVMQQSQLYRFTRFALLQPKSGIIYPYYRYGETHWSVSAEQDLLEELDEQVSRHRPFAWVTHDGRNYFVRQVILPDTLEEAGILVFCIDDVFFDFIGSSISYLREENVLIFSEEEQILCGDRDLWEESILTRVTEEGAATSAELSFAEDGIFVTAVHSRESGWTEAVFCSEEIILSGFRRVVPLIFLVVVGVSALILLSVSLLSRRISQNVVLIEKGMREYEQGNFSYRVEPANRDEIGRMGLHLNDMATRIDRLMQLQRAAEERKRQLEIMTLQAQINPHFLYNTLGSLKWAAFRANQKELAGSLDALVHLLRFTIKRAGGMVTLREEIEYIKSYVAIEEMRYADAFEIFYEIEEETLSEEIPGFLLQPLIENSLLHGLDMTRPDAGIWVRAAYVTVQGCRYLKIEEEDNGVGMDESARKTLFAGDGEQKKDGLSGIGLAIVDRRLKELYGEIYHTEIISEPGQGTRIELWIPGKEES